MRPVTANGMTSYLGTFDVDDGDLLSFDIRARPDDWPEARSFRFQRRFFFG